MFEAKTASSDYNPLEPRTEKSVDRWLFFPGRRKRRTLSLRSFGGGSKEVVVFLLFFVFVVVVVVVCFGLVVFLGVAGTRLLILYLTNVLTNMEKQTSHTQDVMVDVNKVLVPTTNRLTTKEPLVDKGCFDYRHVIHETMQIMYGIFE